ncbi:hypothetical protein L580_4230 [Serratia fonticola AU-P3(3)]|nr:hypothetical protein L580_4230 [Serratia fonticola AU-P3(3)]
MMMPQACQATPFACFGRYPSNGGKVSVILAITHTIFW